MTQAQIISALETSKELPVAAMRAGVASAEAIAPAIIAVVNKAADGVYLIPRQEQLLFRGIHVLAASRRIELFKPLLRLVKRDSTDLDRLLGNAVTETLSRLLISVYDGDAGGLMAALKDQAIDGYVRWALFGVLARATFDCGIARDVTHAFLDRFERDSLAMIGDAAWEGWQDAIRLLGFDDLAPRVRATWTDERNPQAEADRQDWEVELAATLANLSDEKRFVDDRLNALDDPVEALKWAVDQSRPEKRSARNERIALDQDEIDWLHGFLESDTIPDGAMSLEKLDGFFTALIVSPEVVLPSAYMREIWGGAGPVYDSLEQAEYVMTLLMRHWNSIAGRLGDKQPCAPLMSDNHMLAQPWTDGFMRGVSLHMETWDQHLKRDEKLTTVLGHILLLAVSTEDAAKERVTPERRAKMVENLPLAVLGLHLYWREHASDARRPEVRRAKVGRNEPCPCGSGKKYKRCCSGLGATLH